MMSANFSASDDKFLEAEGIPDATRSGDGSNATMRSSVSRRSILKTIAVGGATVFAEPIAFLGAGAGESYTWKQVKMTGGGFVTGLVIHPTGAVYSRTDVGGAYRWNEATGSWTQLLRATGVPQAVKSDYNVSSIAVSPANHQVVYIAAGDLGQFDNIGPGRVLKSANGGETWTDSGTRWQIRGNGKYRTGSERLAVDPADDNIVYFGSEEAGLWSSSDAGESWRQIPTSQIPTGTPAGVGAGVRFVLFDTSGGKTKGLTSTIYVGVSGCGVYLSQDAGASWTQDLSSDLTPCDAKIAQDGTLYLSFWTGGGLSRRDPVSKTWTSVSPKATTGRYYFGIDPANSKVILAADTAIRTGCFFRSKDGGKNWDSLEYSSLPEDWLANTTHQSWMSAGTFVFDPHIPGRVWFPEGFGVWRTGDITRSTITWNYVSDGIEELVTMDAIAPPGGVLITAVADWNGFRHDHLNAPPIRPILTSSGSAGTSLNYSGGNPQFIAAISSDTNHRKLDMSGYSADGGKTWTRFSGSRNYTELWGGNIAVSATNTSVMLWLPTKGSVPYLSIDKGATWQPQHFFDGMTGLHESIWLGFKRAMDADKVYDDYFYLYSTANGGAFYLLSKTGGDVLQWAKTKAAPPCPAPYRQAANTFNQIHAAPRKAGHVWASTQLGLFYTTDSGNTWTAASGVQSAQSFGFGMEIRSYPTIFLYGTVHGTEGLWRSTDMAATWNLIATTPLDYYTSIHVVSGDMNIAGRVYVGLSGNSFVYGDSY